MTQQNSVLFEQHFAVPYSCQQRSYQFIELSNGIHGLVITDPSEDLASCCLSVAAGHHSNPDNIPGLAHLCEHMISLSSKDYPEIDAYRKAVHLAGGSRNALTTNESTSYFFSIPITSSQKEQSDFENILDIFTSNFKNPSFESNYSNREIYAVDNEHTLNKTKKNRLAFQGYKLLANNKHQFSRFSTGNFESLTNISKKHDIKTQLLEFFKLEYTPDKMVFVLRGPQSLNFLQRLAISKFGKIGTDLKKNPISMKTIHSPAPINTNILSKSWHNKYNTQSYMPNNMRRAVLINKDLDPLIRIAFPVCFTSMKTFSTEKLLFFINFWCDIFGSESSNTLASTLLAKELIITITTKTNIVTYDTLLLEIELSLTEFGIKNISLILDIIYNFISLFTSNADDKFSKHLAKNMSQFNGICIYNFLNSEAESNSVWEVKALSNFMLENINSYGKFFLKGLHLYDDSTPGFCGAYSESNGSKSWWITEAKDFQLFMKQVVCFDNCIISYVGNMNNTNLDWVVGIPNNFNIETDFDFEYKIAMINSKVINTDNFSNYKLNISPPNIFAEDIIDNQSLLLQYVTQTIDTSNVALGYSVKNISSLDVPKLIHHDQGCQLWMKTEIDTAFKNKILLTVELINTKIGVSPKLVAILETLVQLVRYRINGYLYPAMTMNYCYDLFPSFKGDTGILLHVSGPNHKFNKVLMVIIYELKLLVDTFQTCITTKEFEKAKDAIILRYENASNISSMQSAVLGLMATMEENTWMLNQRIDACKSTTIEMMASTLPNIFSTCYLTSFLQGDIDGNSLKDTILPIITKLVDKFEGEDHQFPSSVMLPVGSNYYVHTFTKDDTNCVEYFIQTCLRTDITKRSITKFITFIMSSGLVNKIRTEYQLGYIALVGLKSFRKTQGIHIAVVSGSHSADSLDSKLDDIIIEWYEQNIKKLKTSQLSELIEKFIASETAANKSLSASGGKSSIFFGVLGGSGGDKKIIKQHNSYWEQIENKTYAFPNNMHGEDSIDLESIKNLTVQTVDNFIVNEILPTSKNRSKISIQVDSKCSKEEVESKFKSVQLFIFLSSMGLPIKKEHLDEILENSGDSQIVLGKSLYKYYRGKGKSITLIASMIAKLSTSMLFSANDVKGKVEPAIPKLEIDEYHLREWQTSIGYIKDSISMKQKIQNF